MKTSNWSLQTRFLHIGLALTVSAQLLISLVMSSPDHKGSAFSKLAFEIHEIVGLTALAIVIAHWIWSTTNKVDGGLTKLFPLGSTGRNHMINELRDIRNGNLPNIRSEGGVVSFVHGLGLLAVTGIALTGGILFMIFPESGEPDVLVKAFAEIHEGLAVLVWTYWIGHGGMALIHHFMGQDVLKNMFTFRRELISEDTNLNRRLED